MEDIFSPAAVENGRQLLSIAAVRPSRSHRQPVAPAFTFSERYGLLALAESRRQVRIWSLERGEELVRLSPQRPINRLWFSSDARSLIVTTDDSIERYLWRIEDLLAAAAKRLGAP